MTNSIKVEETVQAIQVKLSNVKVIYNNLSTTDLFGKNGITIQGFEASQFDQFTTAKDGVLPTIRCSGKPNEKNIFGEIEQGDIVNVLVSVERYEDQIYPRILAVRLIEKAVFTSKIDDNDYNDLV